MKSQIEVRAIHTPRLDTVVMIEKTIRKMDSPTKNQLWRALPKMVMWQTLGVALGYLADSNKILIGRDGRIAWIFSDGASMDKALKKTVPYAKARKTYW